MIYLLVSVITLPSFNQVILGIGDPLTEQINLTDFPITATPFAGGFLTKCGGSVTLNSQEKLRYSSNKIHSAIIYIPGSSMTAAFLKYKDT